MMQRALLLTLLGLAFASMIAAEYWNSEGYSREGYWNREGYSREGYSREGYWNREGYSREGWWKRSNGNVWAKRANGENSDESDSLICVYATSNSTISCLNGDLICEALPVGIFSQKNFAHKYVQFSIGYKNLTNVKESGVEDLKFGLYPKSSSQETVETEPVALKNETKVELSLYHSDKYKDSGLRVVDQECFDHLDRLINIENDRQQKLTQLNPSTAFYFPTTGIINILN